jgi:hypothetical protein
LRVPFDIHERQILDKTALGVYEFNPEPNRQYWTYLTSGMSEKGQKLPSNKKIYTELLFYSTEQSLWAIELLVKLSAYPFDHKEHFASGDTLPLADPIKPNSKLTALLLLEPFLEHPGFQFLNVAGKEVEILWVFPISERERGLIISGEGPDFRQLISRDRLPSLLDLDRDTF